jgi:hypothetical protein
MPTATQGAMPKIAFGASEETAPAKRRDQSLGRHRHHCCCSAVWHAVWPAAVRPAAVWRVRRAAILPLQPMVRAGVDRSYSEARRQPGDCVIGRDRHVGAGGASLGMRSFGSSSTLKDLRHFGHTADAVARTA